MTHPQNCGTCKRRDQNGYGWCKFAGEHVNPPNTVSPIAEFTSRCGCASWSNGQPQEGLYLITEEELTGMIYNFYNGFFSDGSAIAAKVRSHPYQSERVSEEKPCDHCDFQEIENNLWKAEQKARASERDKVLETLQELKGYMEAWRRANHDLNEIEKGENIVLNCYIPYLERKIEELRQAGEP